MAYSLFCHLGDTGTHGDPPGAGTYTLELYACNAMTKNIEFLCPVSGWKKTEQVGRAGLSTFHSASSGQDCPLRWVSS